MKKFKLILSWIKWKWSRFLDKANSLAYPARLKNERMFRKLARDLRLRQEANKKYEQDNARTAPVVLA